LRWLSAAGYPDLDHRADDDDNAAPGGVYDDHHHATDSAPLILLRAG